MQLALLFIVAMDRVSIDNLPPAEEDRTPSCHINQRQVGASCSLIMHHVVSGVVPQHVAGLLDLLLNWYVLSIHFLRPTVLT